MYCTIINLHASDFLPFEPARDVVGSQPRALKSLTHSQSHRQFAAPVVRTRLRVLDTGRMWLQTVTGLGWWWFPASGRSASWWGVSLREPAPLWRRRRTNVSLLRIQYTLAIVIVIVVGVVSTRCPDDTHQFWVRRPVKPWKPLDLHHRFQSTVS